jgi:glycosyltransferase involved in cell wall biosynthesis
MTTENSRGRRKFVFVNRYSDPDQSATSQMLTDLAQGLVADGLEVHVVCSRQLYTDAGARLPPSEKRSGVFIHRVATTRFGRARLIGRGVDYASFYFSACFALLRLLRSGNVLIAKTDPPLISVLAAVVANVKGATLINWQQDVFPEVASLLGANPLPRWLDALLRRLRDSSLRSARMNVLISNRMRQHFQERGIPAAKLRVIDNWADAKAIVPKPTGVSALRRRLGFSDKFVVCYSGNLGRAHEFDTLLAAADALRLDTSIVFLMIGGGARMEALRLAVSGRGLDNFHFLPYQPREELEDSLAAADLHLISLLPALEGLIMPSKLYGILAAGRPLVFIGDSEGDIARIIRCGDCGVTIEVNAHQDLVRSILRLKSDPQSCVAMGERARGLLLSRYSLDKAVEQWKAVLDVGPVSVV